MSKGKSRLGRKYFTPDLDYEPAGKSLDEAEATARLEKLIPGQAENIIKCLDDGCTLADISECIRDYLSKDIRFSCHIQAR
jgi:hypothetical protein